MTFERVVDAIMEIKNESSRNGKIALLKKHASLPGFKQILQFIYNPYIRTGIGKQKLNNALPSGAVRNISWEEAIKYFTEHQTGTDADTTFAKDFVNQFVHNSSAYEVAVGIVTKDLKIGITETTLNQVYGNNFIPKIGIMRGMDYNDVKDKVKGPFIVTEKLDGARRLLIKENGRVTFYTRNGHIDDGLIEIEKEAVHLPDNCVYDGELLAIGEFSDSIALRQATNSIANSKGKKYGLTYNIFDMIPVDEFKKGKSKTDALTRKTLLAALFNDEESLKKLFPDNWQKFLLLSIDYNFNYIKPVPVLGVVETEEEILDLAKPIWERNFEGVMLNTVDGLYEVKSSKVKQLLKVKTTMEFKLKVIEIFEGTGKYKGMMGGVMLDYKGYAVGCGSGFTDQQRKEFWEHPERIVGKYVEIESFGVSKNQAGGISLNCPIFKRIVGDE